MDDGEDDFCVGGWVELTRAESGVRVRVATGDGEEGEYLHDRAYLLLDERGQETGLAITPAVDTLRDNDVIRDERGRIMLRSPTWEVARPSPGPSTPSTGRTVWPRSWPSSTGGETA